MESFIQLCVNNGLGIASFVALILFMIKGQNKTNEVLEEINKTLITIQLSLTSLSERISDLEEKKEK